MRIGTAISVVFHTTLVVVLLMLAGVNTFEPTTAEAITVDIVPDKAAPVKPKLVIPVFNFDKKDLASPDEKTSDIKPVETKPAETKPAPEKSAQDNAAEKSAAEKNVETKPADTKMPQTSAAALQSSLPRPTTSPPIPQQQSAPPAQPQPQQAEQQIPQAAPIPYANLTQKFASLTGSDNSNFDAPATVAADVTVDAITALRRKIKECAVLPKSVSPDDRIEFVLRVALRRDGSVAGEPDLFKIVKPTEDGAALTVSARKAILACQPYTMLPADKYNEWKTLDLSFTTRDFKGG